MAAGTATVSTWLEPVIHSADERQGFLAELVCTFIQFFGNVLRADHGKALDDEEYQKLHIQAQSFSLWSDNFDSQEGGLDSIVAESQHLKDTLFAILTRIGRNLTIIGISQSDTDTYYKLNQELDALKYQVSDESSEGDSSSVSTTSSSVEAEESSYLRSYSLAGSLEYITLCNDLLLDLVPALRNPAKDEITTSGIPESIKNVNLTDERARPFVYSILEVYPTIEVALAKRLGEANWNRRQKLVKQRGVRVGSVIQVDADAMSRYGSV